MKVSILNIGDELLIGQVVNTNASAISKMLISAGMDVVEVVVCADDRTAILNNLNRLTSTNDAVLMTGGLGPTKDDITKKVLCEFYDSHLVENQTALDNVKRIFEARGYELTPINRQQSWVPECCTVINNVMGTAPCMWFERDGKVVVSMPGVPFEMENLMRTEVLPRLQQHFRTGHIVNKNILVQGIGESFLSDLIEPWELALPQYMRLAYLPQAGMVKLRITAHGDNRDRLDAAIADAQASAEAYAAVPEVALVVNKTNVYTPQAYIAYANDADRKATIAAYNAGTLTNEEALAFREQMFTNESVVGKLLLSAWGENPALSVAADGSLVATGNVTATMVNVENGIYDVTADVQTEADATFEATGREAVAVAAELAAEAELKEQGNLTLTFNVPAGATVTFRNLWFELNREKTAGRDKEDELADAKAKWEAAMADLQKAYDEAVELKESVEESTLEAESVAELNDAIAAGGLLLGEDIALVTTSDYVNKTKELTAAAKRLRAITLKVKRFITVGIDGVVAGKLDLNAPMYDMNGKRVDRNYRGIVIQNGQKFRRK